MQRLINPITKLEKPADQFGSPAHLWPLSANPVDQVSSEEVVSYANYVVKH